MIYLFQAYFTFKMLPMFTSKAIAILRLIVSLTVTGLFVVTMITGTLAFNGFQGTFSQHFPMFHLFMVRAGLKQITSLLIIIGPPPNTKCILVDKIIRKCPCGFFKWNNAYYLLYKNNGPISQLHTCRNL